MLFNLLPLTAVGIEPVLSVHTAGDFTTRRMESGRIREERTGHSLHDLVYWALKPEFNATRVYKKLQVKIQIHFPLLLLQH